MQLNKNISNEYISNLNSLEIKSEFILKGSIIGLHHSPFHGYSSEFAQYKNYSPGDDLRHFDWKVYGKSEKLVLKQFREETNTNIYVILDSSNSMNFSGSISMTKWNVACLLTGSIALLTHKQRDRFSLIHGSENPIVTVSPKSGSHSLKEVYKSLESLKPKGTSNIKQLFQRAAPMIKSNSITIVFSDFWENTQDVIYGIKSIHNKSKAVILVHLTTPEENEFYKEKQVELRDLETNQKIKISVNDLEKHYLSELQNHLFQLKNECSKRKIPFISISNEESLIKSMRKILSP